MVEVAGIEPDQKKTQNTDKQIHSVAPLLTDTQIDSQLAVVSCHRLAKHVAMWEGLPESIRAKIEGIVGSSD